MESGSLLPFFASKLADSIISKVIGYFHAVNWLGKYLLF